MRLIASSLLLKPHTESKDFFTTVLEGGQPCGSALEYLEGGAI